MNQAKGWELFNIEDILVSDGSYRACRLQSDKQIDLCKSFTQTMFELLACKRICVTEYEADCDFQTPVCLKKNQLMIRAREVGGERGTSFKMCLRI